MVLYTSVSIQDFAAHHGCSTRPGGRGWRLPGQVGQRPEEEAVQDEGGWGALDNDSLVAGAAGGTSTLVVKCKVL
jgi:hypothetical protein